MFVWCGECKSSFTKDEIKTLNIGEDLFGADVIEFLCPICKKTRESNVVCVG